MAKVFITDGGLGYGQAAFLILLEGRDYLCIATQGIDEDDTSYQVGEVIKDLEDIYVSPSDFKLEDSPLFKTYLFQHFLKTV